MFNGATIADVPDLSKLAVEYRHNAERCHAVATFLQTQSGRLFWQSRAATTFKGTMGEYVRMLQRFAHDFHSLSTQIEARVALLKDSGNVF